MGPDSDAEGKQRIGEASNTLQLSSGQTIPWSAESADSVGG
jgi:hypothetical protein